jgi:hypothetical protein
MGAIVFRGAEFVPTLSETVGYKSGLTIGEERLHDIVDRLGLSRYWPDDAEAWYRIRSEEYEELFAAILGQLGAGPPRRIVSPLIDVFHRAKKDPQQRAVFDVIAPALHRLLGVIHRGGGARHHDRHASVSRGSGEARSRRRAHGNRAA